MGSECFNGRNNDIEISIKSNREGNIISLDHSDYLNYQQNSPCKNINNQTNYKNYKDFKVYKNQSFTKNNLSKIDNSTQEKSNQLKLSDCNRKKNIHNFTQEELQDQINDILRVRIPFFNNSILKTLSAFTFLSGNGPYHEGLLFFTTNKKFYIAQSYPITFMKVFDFNQGIQEIINYNSLNNDSKKYNIPEIYSPQETITLNDILNIINFLPNKYSLLNDNCQNFCNKILNILNQKFNIIKDDSPNMAKINFLKKQKKINGYNNNSLYYKLWNNSGRIDNL